MRRHRRATTGLSPCLPRAPPAVRRRPGRRPAARQTTAAARPATRSGCPACRSQSRRPCEGVRFERRPRPSPRVPSATCRPAGPQTRPADTPARLCFVFVDPGTEIAGRQRRERQQQVAEIALRIDRDDRHAVDRRLFDEREAQPGLAAAGHPGADCMRHKIAGVVEHRRIEAFSDRDVVFATEIEEARVSRSPALLNGNADWDAGIRDPGSVRIRDRDRAPRALEQVQRHRQDPIPLPSSITRSAYVAFRELPGEESIAQRGEFRICRGRAAASRSCCGGVVGTRNQAVRTARPSSTSLVVGISSVHVARYTSFHSTLTAPIARSSANMRWHRNPQTRTHHSDKETLWLMIRTWTTTARAC